MKAFVLMHADWDGSGLFGVFSSLEKAKGAAEEEDGIGFARDTIEVYEMDDAEAVVHERHSRYVVDGAPEWRTWRRSK